MATTVYTTITDILRLNDILKVAVSANALDADGNLVPFPGTSDTRGLNEFTSQRFVQIVPGATAADVQAAIAADLQAAWEDDTAVVVYL